MSPDISEEPGQVNPSADAGDPPLTITMHRAEPSLVRIEVSGELDLHTLPGMQQALETAYASAPEQLVIDLRRLDFIDSAGLALLVDLHHRFSDHPLAFKLLVSPGGQVSEVLVLSRFDRFFPMEYADQGTAPAAAGTTNG